VGLPEISGVELVGIVGPVAPVRGHRLGGEGEGQLSQGGEPQVAGLGTVVYYPKSSAVYQGLSGYSLSSQLRHEKPSWRPSRMNNFATLKKTIINFFQILKPGNGSRFTKTRSRS
jgi:hypothetical protein